MLPDTYFDFEYERRLTDDQLNPQNTDKTMNTRRVNLVMEYNLFNQGHDQLDIDAATNNHAINAAASSLAQRIEHDAQVDFMRLRQLKDQVAVLELAVREQEGVLSDYRQLFAVGNETMTQVLSLQKDLSDSQLNLLSVAHEYQLLQLKIFEQMMPLETIFGEKHDKNRVNHSAVKADPLLGCLAHACKVLGVPFPGESIKIGLLQQANMLHPKALLKLVCGLVWNAILANARR